ncbi:TonB-dependent siderophore receptor [Sphingosinicella sp. BN140058]|uniref:TonB-dependent receptor plug domain-containing protein n=1 Tax=Sphingosinicella sp. BN140058 TaxID=1892855 RepID=UPI0010126DFB|nr:TonB-dependent receptor [Sphingosinicella sp. BN140058]QAY79385.1 TonB-dependent receptor [Sphingosinicella sp. BN140058]
MSAVLILAAFAAGPVAGTGEENADTIVVTAAREPVQADAAPVSATVFAGDTIAALALPSAADLLRLSPGVSVSTTGPRGTQTQLRIRGAEANHTLLFVDGIRFNDPAAGNEARFELLTTDALSRVEIVRGPQSALWGSEALGGVIALDTANPVGGTRLSLLGEYGSFDSARASAQFAAGSEGAGVSGSAGWLRSDGIDSFGSGGERDGFETFSASLKGVVRPAPGIELGLVGHYIGGTSEFDGTDPLTFARADTLDETRNRIGAVRGWAKAEIGGWSLSGDLGWLGSSNRNRLGDSPLNRTSGERLSAGGQVSRGFGAHRLTAAVEHEAEDFRARDQIYFGGTDQDRSRHLTALVGEWHAGWSDLVSTDVSLRHDSFSAFRDATTVRATMVLTPAAGWRLHAAYGEGIAQPSFYDLYGFFPGSFVGNPALTPERSRGWEAGVRWQQGAFAAGLTGFSNRLTDEIVDTFDSVTFLSSTANAEGKSRRKGIEVDGSWRVADAATIAFNYTYLDAEEQKTAGVASIRELRRPRHSANLIASGTSGRFSWGASAAYVGKRGDTDFDLFPSPRVTLDDYLLASLRLGWQVGDGIEAYARVENGLDADYQDVVGYNTPGRAVYAGLRFRLGD